MQNIKELLAALAFHRIKYVEQGKTIIEMLQKYEKLDVFKRKLGL